MTPTVPVFNLSKSIVDPGDYYITSPLNDKLNPDFSLENSCPPVFDQGAIGSCTANAAATAFSFLNKKKTRQHFIPSRLFIYYNTRSLEGTLDEDSGATLRNTMRSLRVWGACSESLWIYDPRLLFKKPLPKSYIDAEKHQTLLYTRVPLTVPQMKSVLVKGIPFVMGIAVYSSFMASKTEHTGKVPYPDVATEELLGGHAICIIGYSDTRQAFLARNSWGADWGNSGNFWLPYTYATDPTLSFDAWVIADIETVRSAGCVIQKPHKTYTPL